MNNGFVIPSWMSLSSNDNFDNFVNNNFSLKIGQVIDIVYPDNNNGFKTITYNILITEKTDGFNQFVLYNCQLLDSFGGLADYLTYTLRKNEKDVFGITKGEVKSSELLGTYVLVAMINGSASTPIILGGVPFIDIPKDSDRKVPKEDYGHYLQFTFNGIDVNIDKNGELLLQRFGPTKSDGSLDTDKGKEEQAYSFIQINNDGEIKLSTTSKEKVNDADNLITIKKDGSIEIKIKDGKTLELKDKDGDAKMTLGDGAKSVAVAEPLQQLYNQLKNYIETAKVPTGVGPSGTILAGSGPAPSWDDAIISKSSKLPK